MTSRDSSKHEALLPLSNEYLRTANAALVVENAERRRVEAALAQANDALVAANAALAADSADRAREATTLAHANAELRAANAALLAEKTERERAAAVFARTHAQFNPFAFLVLDDLRWPLQSVRSWARLIESSAGGTLSDRGRKHLEQIHSSMRWMSELWKGPATPPRLPSGE